MFTSLLEEEKRRCSSIKFVKNYTIISPPEQREKHWGERYHIEVPVIGVVFAIEPPAVGAPIVGAPAIGSSSSATEIRAIVVKLETVLYHLKILHSLGSTSSLLMRKSQNASEKEQVAPGEGLEVVKDLIVDDDVEVNFKAISSEYGGSFLKWKKDDEKDDDDKKDVEEETMVVAEVTKTDIIFFNHEEVVGEVYQASADQTTVVSVEEQTMGVAKTEDKAS
ncbi:hypothetical protein GIB67_009543 [Kingdonia uniflora]|uniref:Uncharacterized protein n=1 Tax=Kingdonia uniflora TaxID=39325 RepID=A0A7J7NWN3_9MAGN|nr:hypothetical protein GIB67_009543 [Kingdonia uniflora]